MDPKKLDLPWWEGPRITIGTVTTATLLTGLGLAAVITLSTTAQAAIRQVSRVKLAERLEKQGKTGQLDHLLAYRYDLIFCCAVIRISAILAFVLLVAYMFNVGPRWETFGRYAGVFITSILVIVVLGVAIPNAWARYGSEGFLTGTAPVLLAIRPILRPLLALQHLADGLVRRLAGVPLTDEKEAEADQIEKEILGVVSEGELSGVVEKEDAKMIESVMEFRGIDVAQIMTPRTRIVALPITANLDEARDSIARLGHSRIPLYGENLDDIKGVLYAKDLLTYSERDHFELVDVMRKVPFVPETKLIPDLLGEMKQKKVHLAIVVDEYGGTAGLVTIEDIIEEIVGDISDEYDATTPETMRRIDLRTLEVDARVRIDELNRELDINLPEDSDYDTVGGFVFSEMGKIPTKGEELLFQNLRFVILDAEERKINRLRIQVLAEEKPS